MKKFVANWGNFPRIPANILPFSEESALRDYVTQSAGIARGLGRCYGDSALSSTIFSTTPANKFLDFDEKTGILRAQSGVSLAEILEIFVPRGWFLPVTPGTKFVTLGGAIASDVHGKNHHKEGCFSDHVLDIDIMLENGEILRTSRTENADLFRATCGGMGLTGVMLSASIRLKHVESAFIRQEYLRAKNLDEMMDFFENSQDWTYSVAWMDCLTRGSAQGRGVLFRGEHAKIGELPAHFSKNPLSLPRKKILPVPFNFPHFALNSLTVQSFNTLFYHRHSARKTSGILDYDTYFYPLDALASWNRIYGKNGFTQYQVVLPKAESRMGLEKILETISRNGMGSFLVVLKLFGKQDSLMSFPMEGYTLALDFPIKAGIFEFLNRLDAIVLEHGGRLYLTKDARMSAEMFRKTYPNYEKFTEIIRKYNPNMSFRSLQSERLGITPAFL